jgi:hypothetical protein
MSDDTLLRLIGAGLPPYSARGLTQTLEPIEQASYQRRDLNWKLHNLAPPGARLYRSVIACTDRQAPAFDGLWPGAVLTVHCVERLGQATATAGTVDSDGVPTALGRPAVEGSVRTLGDFTSYRPILVMMVRACPTSFEEWRASRGWEIELEEVEIPVGYA